ncbi:MAG: FlgD immunoglobulin-like domain containing protein [Bacteroidota bacterium]
MKRISFSILFLSIYGQLLFGQTPGQNKDHFGIKIVNIDVTQEWTTTGIICSVGDTLYINVSGLLSSTTNDPSAWCGPDGNGWSSSNQFPTPTAAPFSVIGKIGSTGSGFPVGSRRFIVTDVAGEFFLGINDIVNFSDNGGTLVANIINLRNHNTPSNVIGTDKSVIPTTLTLRQNYPNPFNPSTTIEYTIDLSGNVEIDVFDNVGRLVKILQDGKQSAGSHKIVWNGTDNSGETVATGTYYYQVRVGTQQQTKKALFLK